MAKKASKKEAPKKSVKTVAKAATKPTLKSAAKSAKKVIPAKAVKPEKKVASKSIKAPLKVSKKVEVKAIKSPATKTPVVKTPAAKPLIAKSVKVVDAIPLVPEKEKEEIESTMSSKVRTFKEALAQPLTVEKEKKPEEVDAERKEELDRITPEDLAKKPAKKYQGSTDEESKWLELKDKYKWLKPQSYKMTEVYKDRTILDHKVLGLGFILSVVNDRLEVLFQTGTKQLISNYKK